MFMPRWIPADTRLCHAAAYEGFLVHSISERLLTVYCIAIHQKDRYIFFDKYLTVLLVACFSKDKNRNYRELAQ